MKNFCNILTIALMIAFGGVQAMAQSDTDTTSSQNEMSEVDVMYQMGLNCYRGGDMQVDYAKAFEWFSKAADKGHVEAMTHVGTAYYFGEGVTRDYRKAISWYQKAAEKGHPEAMRLLGVCYDDGFGTQKNLAKAREWYQKAAEAGDATAMYFLAELSKNAGNEKDATEWYLRAAEAGHAKSMGIICRRYEKGIGCEKDQAKADEWGQKARANGQLFF